MTAALFVLELIIIVTIITKTLSSSSLWPSRSWSLSPAATLEAPPTPQTALTGSPNGPGQMPPLNKNLEKQKTKETFLRQFVHRNIFPWVQQPTINDRSAQKYVLLQDCKAFDLLRKVTKDTWTHLSVTSVWSLAAKVKVKNCSRNHSLQKQHWQVQELRQTSRRSWMLSKCYSFFSGHENQVVSPPAYLFP